MKLFKKSLYTGKETNWKHSVIKNRKELREWLFLEKNNYSDITPFYKFYPITEHDLLWRYQRRLRITEYYLNTNSPLYLISRIRLHRLQFRYGMKIRLNSCGKGLRVVHQGSIITNGDIGENCQLYPDILVGTDGKRSGVPLIGDKVVICAKAMVVGNVTIPDKVVVGGNSVVTKSVEKPNVTVAGQPAKIVSDVGQEAWSNMNKSWFL